MLTRFIFLIIVIVMTQRRQEIFVILVYVHEVRLTVSGKAVINQIINLFLFDNKLTSRRQKIIGWEFAISRLTSSESR